MTDINTIAKQRLESAWKKAVENQANFIPHTIEVKRDREKAKHYRYDHSEKGIASDRARGARYRAKPEKRALKAEYRKKYYAAHREAELARVKAWRDQRKMVKAARCDA